MEGVEHGTKTNMCNRIILRVGDKFKFNIPKFLRDIEYLYCGKVQVGNKIKALCHKRYLKEHEEANKYCLLSLDYFSSGLRKDIEIIKQNEAQFEASRRMAKKRKERWLTRDNTIDDVIKYFQNHNVECKKVKDNRPEYGDFIALFSYGDLGREEVFKIIKENNLLCIEMKSAIYKNEKEKR